MLFAPPQRPTIFLPDLQLPVRCIAVSLYVHHTDPTYPLGPPLLTPASACVFGWVHHGAVATAVKAHTRLLETIILMFCTNIAPVYR